VRALLAGGADATVADRRGYRPLAVAIARNQGDCVAALLDHGVDLSTSDTNQGGGLVLAVRSLAGLAVDLLLERGADPDALDARAGVTALHVAVALRHEPLVRQLVAAGGTGKVKSKKKLELRGVTIPGGTTAAEAAKGAEGLKGIL
jgi:ankyrin repeat protein